MAADDSWLGLLLLGFCVAENWKFGRRGNPIRQCMNFLTTCICICICVVVITFIVGISLMTSPNSRVHNIEKYNGNIQSFNVDRPTFVGEYSYRLGNYGMEYTLNMVNSTEDIKYTKQNYDPPLDQYKGLKYELSAQSLVIKEPWTDFTQNLHIYEGPLEVGSGISIDVLKKIEIDVYDYDPDVEASRCAKYKNSYYEPSTYSCYQKWALRDICVVVDPVTKKFRNVNFYSGFFGCYRGDLCREDPSSHCPHPHPHDSNDYYVGTYQTVPYNDPTVSTNGKVEVRHYSDPYILLYDSSSGTLSFGLNWWQSFLSGLALVIISSSVCVIPVCLCCTVCILACVVHRRKKRTPVMTQQTYTATTTTTQQYVQPQPRGVVNSSVTSPLLTPQSVQRGGFQPTVGMQPQMGAQQPNMGQMPYNPDYDSMPIVYQQQ